MLESNFFDANWFPNLEEFQLKEYLAYPGTPGITVAGQRGIFTQLPPAT